MWMRAIGGAGHDCWFDVPPGRDHYIVPESRPLTAREVTEFIGMEIEPVRCTEYTVERLIWPGFRFPLYVLVAPGVKMKGNWIEYDSSWPNPLVPTRCRCEELRAWVFRNDYSGSACHLDHCPVHGRWTFAPITPMYISENCREQWLRRRRDAITRDAG